MVRRILRPAQSSGGFGAGDQWFALIPGGPCLAQISGLLDSGGEGFGFSGRVTAVYGRVQHAGGKKEQCGCQTKPSIHFL